ncbi:hypothetical protein SD70_03360 [Gordoniibacillus kamchatkensis]|uniref:Orc1-like AAA ATPase domain-containing protein n=1 Tax=Gordoniibacillus kamchatkensis TaxID=1590651 RepID=A0ABR5ALU7_9BACL|nr:ATP-binding protein [Paenibacillus sp. VKM B-2647]KIL41931.1 hypothetical protein SD70_03360 [Paenibacillus sp. VKM B-2647]
MWVSRSAHAAKGNGISNMKTWMSEYEGLPFVGRTEQLERLSEAMDKARNGRMQTIFIQGEAGIGKMRLVDVTAWRHGTVGSSSERIHV